MEKRLRIETVNIFSMLNSNLTNCVSHIGTVEKRYVGKLLNPTTPKEDLR